MIRTDAGEARPTLVIAADATHFGATGHWPVPQNIAGDCVELAAGSGDATVDWDLIRDALAAHNLKCAGLALDRADANLGAADADVRSKARERIVTAVRDASRLGASYVRIVAAQLDGPAAPRCADATHHVLDALLAVRHEGGLCGVRIVPHLAEHGFLVSPLEARQFLDAVNSPWVGGAISLDAFGSTSTVVDWIETLTHRLAVVRVGDSPGSNLDWSGVGRALAAERFDGFIVSPMEASNEIDNRLIKIRSVQASPAPPV